MTGSGGDVTVTRRPQSGRGFLQGCVDHVERRVRISFTCLIQFQPRGEQRLQRAVVQVLGDFAVVTLIGMASETRCRRIS
jgi:hypothetical protein